MYGVLIILVSLSHHNNFIAYVLHKRDYFKESGEATDKDFR